MALKSLQSKLFIGVISLALLLTITPTMVFAIAPGSDPSGPTELDSSFGHARNRLTKILPHAGISFIELADFIKNIKNGNRDQFTGIYIPELLAARIVQQPVGLPEFVSPRGNIVTQFNAASQFGATGLLAHNFLAGAVFDKLSQGRSFQLIYGDGRTEKFVVAQVLRYQALQPENPISDFIDLDSGLRVSSGQVFSSAYNRPGNVVLQTCIEAEGIKSWGRLFVIAEPIP